MSRRFMPVIAFLSAALLLAQELECTDNLCFLPSAQTVSQAETSVAPEYICLSPVADVKVEPLPQKARLKTLEGKTIALVGGSFMASVTHPELKRLILEEYPTAKVYLLNEIGSAGPYPRPGVVRHEKDEFQRKLLEFQVDAVISGNGGCGLCTPKETGSCIAAEVMGIPSVMIAAPGFVRQAKTTAATAGIGILRVAEYPGAFASHTREELLQNTCEVLWPQIKTALTTPFTNEEFQEASPSTADAVAADLVGSFDDIQRIFRDSGWTDGLPIIPPTTAAVAEFLKFTDLEPDHMVGEIPPAQRTVTVRHVAVNGVMAGCPPEFMPLLLAFAEAMKDGNFRRTLVSTHAWTPYCWLNGPVARQLGFDSAQGEISEPKNAVFGRFINLALLNLGGYKVKENRMGTFGYLMPWCLVEDDQAALEAGWKPYHLQRGFALNESTLSAASAINWGNNLVPATSDAVKIKDMMAWDAVEKQQMAVGSGMPCVYRTFLLTPDVTKALSTQYPSKEALEQALVETARVPLAQRTFANYWGNPGSSFDGKASSFANHQARIAEEEHSTMTATPPWLEWIGAKSLETVPAMQEGKSVFLVTGDPTRNKELCLPGGGSVTVKIVLPADWDALIAERGYQPLSSFYLKSDVRPDRPKPLPKGYSRPGVRGDRQNQRPRRPSARPPQ